MVPQGVWDEIDETRAQGLSDYQITAWLGLSESVNLEAEGRALVDYGHEQYEAGYATGYDTGYAQGKQHHDWGDFAQDTACYVGGNAPVIGFAVDSICYVNSVL